MRRTDLDTPHTLEAGGKTWTYGTYWRANRASWRLLERRVASRIYEGSGELVSEKLVDAKEPYEDGECIPGLASARDIPVGC
jgi:hypothetical protein